MWVVHGNTREVGLDRANGRGLHFSKSTRNRSSLLPFMDSFAAGALQRPLLPASPGYFLTEQAPVGAPFTIQDGATSISSRLVWHGAHYARRSEQNEEYCERYNHQNDAENQTTQTGNFVSHGFLWMLCNNAPTPKGSGNILIIRR